MFGVKSVIVDGRSGSWTSWMVRIFMISSAN